MRQLLPCLLLCSLVCPTASLAESSPALSGYITQIESPTHFQVNGVTVLMSSATPIGIKTQNGVAIPSPVAPYLGAEIQIYGKLDSKRHDITATKVILSPAGGDETKGLADSRRAAGQAG